MALASKEAALTADESDTRIARIEELLGTSTADEALRVAEEWLAQGEVRIARLALIRAKSIQARAVLNDESADEPDTENA